MSGYKYSSYQKLGENEPRVLSSAPPQRQSSSLYDESSVDSDSFLSKLPQSPEAEELSMRLVACNDNEKLEEMVLRQTLDLSQHNAKEENKTRPSPWNIGDRSFSGSFSTDRSLLQNLVALVVIAMLGLIVIFVFIEISSLITGPPSLPVGQYTLIELQVRTILSVLFYYMIRLQSRIFFVFLFFTISFSTLGRRSIF
jgi:hypothetical protein